MGWYVCESPLPTHSMAKKPELPHAAAFVTGWLAVLAVTGGFVAANTLPSAAALCLAWLAGASICYAHALVNQEGNSSREALAARLNLLPHEATFLQLEYNLPRELWDECQNMDDVLKHLAHRGKVQHSIAAALKGKGGAPST